jgi:MFS family permease
MAILSLNARTTPYYGWYIVAAMAVVAFFAWGLGFYSLGFYLSNLGPEHGWTKTLMSSAVTIYYLVGAILYLLVGSLIDRYGPQRVLVAGAISFCAGLTCLTAARTVSSLYGAFLLMSLGWGSLTVTTISTTLAPWFRKKQGTASGLAFTGASVGGIVCPPLLVWLSAHIGFALALKCLAAVALMSILVLATLVVKRRPEDLGLHPDGEAEPSHKHGSSPSSTTGRTWTRNQAIRSEAFWSITLPFAMALFVQVGFFVHQIPFLQTILDSTDAAWVVSITTASAIIGRLVTGPVADRINPRLLACFVMALQAVSIACLSFSQSMAALAVNCFAFGAVVGNVVTLPALIVLKEFGLRSFGTVVSSVNAITHSTFALGPLTVGVIYDRWGGYVTAWQVFAAIDVLALMLTIVGLKRANRSNGD